MLLFFSVVPSSRIRPIFLRDRLESFFFFVRTWKCAFFSNFYDRQPCPSYFPSVYGTESVLLCTFDNIEKSFSETFRSRRIRTGSICLARVSAIFSPVIKCLWTLVYFSCYYYLIIYECRQLLKAPTGVVDLILFPQSVFEFHSFLLSSSKLIFGVFRFKVVFYFQSMKHGVIFIEYFTACIALYVWIYLHFPFNSSLLSCMVKSI